MKINNNKIKSLFLLSLVGSGLAKEESSKNQTAILNDNQIPQMAADLTERQNNPDKTLFFGGMPIAFGDQLGCGSGFVVVPNEENNPSSCMWGNSVGFLTSAQCCNCCETYGACRTRPICGSGADGAVSLVSDDPNKVIGSVLESACQLDIQTIDFAFVSLSASDITPIPYVMGNNNSYPVTGLGSVSLGSRICAYGSISGHLCGELGRVNITEALPNVIFTNLNAVGLGTSGFEYKEDLGGPVYVETNVGDRTVAQALGYVTFVDNGNPDNKQIYYTPLDEVLKRTNDNGCSYTLMTYNETNAQEYDELIAQVEIPPKN
jgi:hypothetical protein